MEQKGIRRILIEKGLEGAIIFLAELFERMQEEITKPKEENQQPPVTGEEKEN